MDWREIRAKIVLRDQKQHCMNITYKLLHSVCNDPYLLQRVTTLDESLIYGYDFKTKLNHLYASEARTKN